MGLEGPNRVRARGASDQPGRGAAGNPTLIGNTLISLQRNAGVQRRRRRLRGRPRSPWKRSAQSSAACHDGITRQMRPRENVRTPPKGRGDAHSDQARCSQQSSQEGGPKALSPRPRETSQTVTMTRDARGFFTGRHATCAWFIQAMRYPHGLRAFWMASPLLRSGLRILDAGCGTGALTLAVWDACQARSQRSSAFHAFDLTPAMLDHLRATIRHRALDGIGLAEAHVLHLEWLPAHWHDYDLVVSASMLEYVPRDRFAEALTGLRARLRPGGRFTLFVTSRNPLTRLLIGKWWASNLYTRGELVAAFATAGFSDVAFRRFPRSAWHLWPWGHIVEAANPGRLR